MRQILLAFAACNLALGAAFAQQPSAPAGNIDHGKALFHDVGCYACHGLVGQGAQATGPRLSRTQLPFEGFLAQLRRPQSQMPPYEAVVLSDQDAADIYAYVRQIPPPSDPKSIPLLKSER